MEEQPRSQVLFLSLSLRRDWENPGKEVGGRKGHKIDNSFINLKPHWYKIKR